jgi:Gas vesicle synthesis protein GvpO
MAQRRITRRAEEDADDHEREEEVLDEDEVLDDGEPAEADDGEPAEADEDEPNEADEDEPAEADKNRRRPARRRRNSGLTAREAAKAALRQIAELTGKSPEGITGMERTEDGWAVGIEVVEDRRVPSSADILATYESIIDADGELLSCRRVRRYARGRADDGEGS